MTNNTIVFNMLSRTLVPYLYMFLIGTFLYVFRDEVLSSLVKYWWILLGIYIVYCSFSKFSYIHRHGFYTDPITGIMVCTLAIVIGYVPFLGNHHVKTDISYEIFLYHFPVMNFFIYIGLSPSLLAITLLITITIFISYLSKIFVLHMLKKNNPNIGI